MKIYLLTHERECDRLTNTGRLAIELFPQEIRRIVWSRVTPNQQLSNLAEKNQLALLHPSGQPISELFESTGSGLTSPAFVLIDATWQESQKIFNRTTYLKSIPSYSLRCNSPSDYLLRRNQKPNGLCTIECIIELYKTHNEIEKAEQLMQRFSTFNQIGDPSR